MSDGRLLVAVVAGSLALAAAAVAVGAATEPDPRPTGPGFGSDPVTPAEAHTAPWAAAVDGLVPGLDATSANPCQAGRPACLDAVVGEMQDRIDALGCAHTAPFAHTYLVTTEGVGRRVADDGFFVAPEDISHLDALFARLYFEAFDSWAAGRRDEVPGAWQVAFTAAEGGRTSAAADMLLGMNAHISRDLAHTVALVVAAEPRHAEDATDFRRVNDIIREVMPAMLEEAAARFDPRMDDLGDELGVEVDLDVAELIATWRDEAFAFGVRMARAPTPEARRAVEAEVERASVAAAMVILNADAVADLGLPPAERDAYCATPG